MALVLNGISKHFGRDKPVIDRLSMAVRDGEFVCLLGESGCGKSTLLNMIAGLDKPDAGEIIWGGVPVTGPDTARGYIFQEAALFPWLNVLENVKFGMKMRGLRKEEQQRRALHYLRMVKLDEYGAYRVHELSGGMKQRAALARALALDSPLLLMDEPFAALDSHTRTALQCHLLDIWRETHRTILFVTHSIPEAFILADRVVVLASRPAVIKKEYYIRPRNMESRLVQGMMEEARILLAASASKTIGE
jgi:NitT/TauT family transport system ATP-binding protein